MSFRRSNITRIGGILKSTLHDMGLQEKILQQQAMAKWPEVVGSQIARSTAPESVRDGILFVCCKSSMWSSELSLHKDDILKRLNKAVGKEVVKDIRFSARGFRKAADETAQPSSPPNAGKVEVSPEEAKAADKAASVCASDELAQRVRQAILASKRRRTS